MAELRRVGSFVMLPPPEGVCQVCAVAHHPDDAHNPQSLYYQTWWYAEHGRVPTWVDALAHCPPERRAAWVAGLAEQGVEVGDG